jgi:DNA-directed RNA polymerase specialized sigma24 family protein
MDKRVIDIFREARPDYLPQGKGDIFFDGDDRAELCKRIVFEHLDIAERTFLILYAETHSYSEIARMMGVSHTSIRTEINRIRDKIIAEYERRKSNEL